MCAVRRGDGGGGGGGRRERGSGSGGDRIEAMSDKSMETVR